jgi:CubicO group peptidase (beta-lactamase class C family)
MRKITFLILFAGSLFPSKSAKAQTFSFQSVINLYLENHSFNGTILIAKGDSILFSKGFGNANYEWNIPNDTDTKFRIASLTKQFTAMLVLQQVQTGEIKLEATVHDYLPDYPKRIAKKVTIEELLTHTSGIPDFGYDYWSGGENRKTYSPGDLLALFKKKKLEFKPGSSFDYSNAGYVVLGNILEKVTGKRFDELAKENIFQPLHMNETGYELPGYSYKNLAEGYDFNYLHGFAPADYISSTALFSCGGLFSTATDLLKWNEALQKHKFLDDELYQKYFSPAIKSYFLPNGIPASKVDYAFGWEVCELKLPGNDSVKAVFHHGIIAGFNAMIFRIPENDFCVIILSNQNIGTKNLFQITGNLLRFTYHMPFIPVKKSLTDFFSQQGNQAATFNISDFYKKYSADTTNYYSDPDEWFELANEFYRDHNYPWSIVLLQWMQTIFPGYARQYVFSAIAKNYESRRLWKSAIENYQYSINANARKNEWDEHEYKFCREEICRIKKSEKVK